MKILDGKLVNSKIAEKLKVQISKLETKPKLVIVQVGNLPESNSYIARKEAFGEKIGAAVDHKRFDEKITQKELISQLSTLSSQLNIHGIIVQLPIPKHLNTDKVIDAISFKKDVDGLTSISLKLLWENNPVGCIPATTKGIISLLNYYKIPIVGKKVVVVGRSFSVGKPTALAFLNRDATVSICHKHTKNLKQETKNADILVVATGKPNLIGKKHVSKDQIVIDVGINVINNKRPSSVKTLESKPESEPSGRKLVGDVNFESVSKIVSAISPVPGGVGPMTVASLFENLLKVYKQQSNS